MTDRDDNPSSNHPPLPPTSEDEQFSRLRLLRSRRVGIATYKRLLTEYGTAQKALAALPQVARAAGVENYQPCPEQTVTAELNLAHRIGAQLVMHGTPVYPKYLNELSDAPPFLWVLGDPGLLHRPMISIVGARNASSLGTRMAQSLARDLGKAGFIVVSGLARGVDAAAHKAALSSGTIAVQAGGVDIIYPAENTDLAMKIAQRGLRVSEQPMGMQPTARHFPTRNRIISGLSHATVVVEAASKSGSLITARGALDQGREVLAVPGHPVDARAAGCNGLIRDGATLVRSGDDVLEALAPITAKIQAAQEQVKGRLPPAKTAVQRAAALHARILSRLGPTAVPEDQLIRDLAVSPGDVAPALVDLELDGHISRKAGGLVARLV